MKKIISYFLALFTLTLIYSCSTDLEDKSIETEKAQMQLEELLLEIQDIQNQPLDNTSSAQNPGGIGGVGGFAATCYNAHLMYDIDCDGIYETAANILTANMTCCLQKNNQLANLAAQQGYCYSFGENICLTFDCNPVALCN